MQSIPKPKLVFFQQKCDPQLPAFLLQHKREHVKCLSESFDVTVIHEQCDYQRICDKYRPDLTLFESGLAFPTCQRLQIANTQSCPTVPKLGLLNADGFCHSRAAFLSDMDHWGIDTFFSIAVTAAEHTPAVTKNLFIWPNFVDPDTYHDYSQWKSIPVLFTGAQGSYYPWRQKMFWIISRRYPCLSSPHPGYFPISFADHSTISGERYSRTLNASCVVPTCGSMAKELVRKHLEIPACRACLVTEASPALLAAGFIDMKNCVFADEHDILDKLAYLFSDTEQLRCITDAGYELVHSRHTIRQRNQISQWFELHKQLKPHQGIVQISPFEPLRVVDKATGIANCHIVSDGTHLVLLRRGDKKLWQGDYRGAAAIYVRCSNYFPYMPEPQLRLALCNLYMGKARAALYWITKPLEFTLGEFKARDPDPVEWACLILSLLCLGRIDEAAKHCQQFEWVHHAELDRMKWLTSLLKNPGNGRCFRTGDIQRERRSIHQLPWRNFEEWARHIRLILQASGQSLFAERVAAYEKSRVPRYEGPSIADHNVPAQREMVAELTAQSPNGSESFEAHQSVAFGEKRMAYARTTAAFERALRAAFKRPVKRMAHLLETKYAYFLPYKISASQNDVFFHAIRELTRKYDIRAALIIGANSRQYSSNALFAGARESDSKPAVFCLSLLMQRQAFTLAKVSLADPSIRWYTVPGCSPEHVECVIKDIIGRIQEEHRVAHFDAILIDGSEVREGATCTTFLAELLVQAKLVFLDDINTVWNQQNYHSLIRNPRYYVVQGNPDLRNGHAIFARTASDGSDGVAAPTSATGA